MSATSRNVTKATLGKALERLLNTPSPNYPIAGFEGIERDVLAGIIEALEISKDNLLVVVLDTIEEIFVSIELDDDDHTQDQLAYYYSYNKVRDAAFALRHSVNSGKQQTLFIDTGEYERDIKSLKDGIESIQQTMDQIREEARRHPLEGFSLSVGPIGIPLSKIVKTSEAVLNALDNSSVIDIVAITLKLRALATDAAAAYSNSNIISVTSQRMKGLLRIVNDRATYSLGVGLKILKDAANSVDQIEPIRATVTGVARTIGRAADSVGVDFGTSEVRIVAKRHGVVERCEVMPSIRGADLTRAEWLRTIKWKDRPVSHGVISDPVMAEEILKRAIKNSGISKPFYRPKIIAAVTSGSTSVERRAMRQVASKIPSTSVQLVESSIASAIGAGFDTSSGDACMVGDIGAGKTEISVIAFNGIVYSRTVKLGGDDMTRKVADYLFRNNNVHFPVDVCERLKVELASARYNESDAKFEEILGADSFRKHQRSISISSKDIYHAILEPVTSIIDSFRHAIEALPPELAHSVQRNGIALTGGVARLPYLAEELAAWIGLPFWVADDPEMAVARGLSQIMDDPHHQRVLELSV